MEERGDPKHNRDASFPQGPNDIRVFFDARDTRIVGRPSFVPRRGPWNGGDLLAASEFASKPAASPLQTQAPMREYDDCLAMAIFPSFVGVRLRITPSSGV